MKKVPPEGFEPSSLVPKTTTLSIELWRLYQIIIIQTSSKNSIIPLIAQKNAEMAELVDAHVSDACEH